MRSIPPAISAAFLPAALAPASADVRLTAAFSDHRVLQRDMPVPVWGWADPGEQVDLNAGAADLVADLPVSSTSGDRA